MSTSRLDIQLKQDICSKISVPTLPSDLRLVSRACEELCALVQPELNYRAIDNNAVWTYIIAPACEFAGS